MQVPRVARDDTLNLGKFKLAPDMMDEIHKNAVRKRAGRVLALDIAAQTAGSRDR